jgi:hypothetical protein
LKNKILLTIGSIIMLSGCANPLLHTIHNTNESFEKKQSPYRYIEIEKEDTHTTFQLEPAGIPNQTIASSSELLLIDIFRGLKQKCGFEKKDLVEIRKVTYKPPQYYEVWVFNDELSKRSDKASAISVVLDVYPDNGGVDSSFAGQCHAEPKQFTFGN